jgi:hypothetical protein
MNREAQILMGPNCGAKRCTGLLACLEVVGRSGWRMRPGPDVARKKSPVSTYPLAPRTEIRNSNQSYLPFGVLSSEVSFSIHFPITCYGEFAKCRQFKRFQSFVSSFPSFGRGFDSHRPLHKRTGPAAPFSSFSKTTVLLPNFMENSERTSSRGISPVYRSASGRGVAHLTSLSCGIRNEL